MIQLENFRSLPLYKLVPVESEYTEIAIVDEPAINEYFMLFNEENIKMTFNDEKKIIKGAVMLPNVPIYRNDKLGERFVIYDEEGIKLTAQLFMKNGLLFNSDHSEKHLDVDIIESYFATEPNEFNVPSGSWIVSAKVNSDEIWNKLKQNKYGFSVQFLGENKLIGVQEFKKETNKMDLKQKLTDAINLVLFGEEKEVIKPEEFVDAPVVEDVPVEVPVEDVPVEDVEVLTEEKVSEMINEAVMSATEQIMSAVKQMFDEYKTSTDTTVQGMSKQIEDFGKQTVTVPVSEVINTNVTPNKFDYLKDIK